MREASGDDEGAAQKGYRASTVRQLGPLGDAPLLDTPFSVNVTPRELLQNLQASKPDDALRYNPVVQISGPQSRFFTSTTLRGFSVGSTKRIDGIPSTTSYVNVDMEDKDRIEVITGLSGFLYGSGNVGGTINYVLKRPTYKPLASVTVGTTEGSNVRLRGDFGGPLDKDGKLAYRLNVVAQDGDTAADHQSLRRSLVSGALDWNLTDDLQLQFDASSSRYRMDGTEPYWSADTGVRFPAAPDVGKYYGQPFTFSESQQKQLGARLQWRANESMTVRTGLMRRETALDLIAVNNMLLGTPATGYRAQASAWEYPDVTATGGYALVDVQRKTGTVEHKFTLGWYGDRDERTNFRSSAGGWSTLTTGAIPLNAPAYVNNPGLTPAGAKYIAQRSRYGNWVLSDQIRFNPQWSALLGLTRASIDDAAYGPTGALSGARYRDSKLTPSVAVLFKPQPALTLYANYMESLEKGGTAPVTYNSRPVSNAGAIMAPLLSEQYEIGAKAELGGMLLTAALFQIDKGLQYVDISNPANYVYVQDGRQVHRGVELTATGRATKQLTLWGGLTLLDAKTRKHKATPALEGKTPANVAEQMAKVYAEYALADVPGLTLTGGVLYTGRQQVNLNNTEQLPAFTTVDAGLRYVMQAAGKPLTWRLAVTNVTNKRYWLNTNYVGRPRTLAVSAQIDL